MAPRWARDADDVAPRYDHVVVGGGAAGCVVAARLADAGAHVLLLEAGPDDAGHPDVADPARWTSLIGGPLDWGHSYEATEAVGGRRIPIPRGRVLGGSSSTNAMLWYRGHPSDYDAWATGSADGADDRDDGDDGDTGAAGWDWPTVLAALRRAEDFDGGASALRGAGGPLRLERPADPHPVARALLAGAAQAGFPVLPDGAGAGDDPRDLVGASLAVLNVGGGRRWSTARGYLRSPTLRLATLTVLTGALVHRVLFDGPGGPERATRAVGVAFSTGSTLNETLVDGEVLLAAGAVESPRLLLASGIGDPADLARLGVPVRLGLPGVGTNLQDHPLLEGVNLRSRAPVGPVRDNGGGAVLNWRSSTPRSAAPDLHAFVVQGPSATAALAAAAGLDRSAGPAGDVIGIGVGLMGSRSRGWMRVHDLAPGGAVQLQPNFLAEAADRHALREGLEAVCELTATPAMLALADERLTPAGPLPLTGAAFAAFVAQACSTFFHLCGTAAMGSGADAVVDPTLAVHGAQDLRVVDASVFPTIPTCNTQAPVVAVAERAADLVNARWAGR